MHSVTHLKQLAAKINKAEKMVLYLEECLLGIQFFYRPALTTYSKVTGMDEMNRLGVHEICLYYRPGERIPAFPRYMRRLGHVMIEENDYQKLLDKLTLADEAIVFHE